MLRLIRIIAIVVVTIVIVLNNASIVRSAHVCSYSSSKTSTCPGDHGRVQIIYPFWIENRTSDDHGDCISYPGFQIKCATNGRPVINLSNKLYYVLSTDHYEGGRLRVVDVDIDAQECPQPQRNISIESIRFLGDGGTVNMTFFYNCSRHPQTAVQHIPCLDNYHNTTGRSFAFLEEDISSHQFDWYENCEEAVVVPASNDYGGDPTDMNYTAAIKSGFRLYWDYPVNCGNCELSGGKCWANETNKGITTPLHCNCPDGTTRGDDICQNMNLQLGGMIHAPTYSPFGSPTYLPFGSPTYFDSPNDYFGSSGYDYSTSGAGMPIVLKIVIGVPLGFWVILVIYYCCRRCVKKLKGQTNVELFLENNYGLSLPNYKYSDIKKMTNSFKDTLGQGGFGSVFKGELRDNRLVAVKVLNESKGKGEDFINEVATIGKTNHVNVVSLLGFCAEGTKRALVYEFMPNGSLEKFIHNAKDSGTSSILGWEKLYQIALGIARGLEYLHRGCNTRILHFDIKPHNILLDKDFCPKIADFGLAKLCPTRDTIVSMVGARGTIGYIAPEVCCRNFGGVSHKSDVYSYGMMVLEMVGGRKNIDVTVENTSEIYFPQWIYRRLRGDIKVEGSEKHKVVVCGEVFAADVTQKMIIVALWCIQAPPGDRPSMTNVVEMLEGNTEDLQLPPNPFQDHSSRPFPSSS